MGQNKEVVENEGSMLTVSFDILKFKHTTFPWTFLYFKIQVSLQLLYVKPEILSANEYLPLLSQTKKKLLTSVWVQRKMEMAVLNS